MVTIFRPSDELWTVGVPIPSLLPSEYQQKGQKSVSQLPRPCRNCSEPDIIQMCASNTLGSSGKAAGLWAARMDGRSVASNPGDMPLMRAMVLANPKSPLKLQHVPVPQPGPGQVRVKVAACAVCRTDLHVVSNSAAHLTLFQKPKEYISGAHLKNCAGSCAPLHTVNSRFREHRLPNLDVP
jgi:hypothetical protein